MQFLLKRKQFIKVFFLLAGFVFCMQLSAQTKGSISTRIVDSLTKKPIEYATISIINQSTDKVVDGGTTDDKGVFKVEKLAEGTYKMLVYFVGYPTYTKTDIIISKANTDVVLGSINLANKQAQLKEVTVTADKSVIENHIDKIVYNAEKDLTSQGGVATDLLKKVPMVAVNVDGTVELQGNSNIRFLINGNHPAFLVIIL
jgi:ferric enterobactin receptor